MVKFIHRCIISFPLKEIKSGVDVIRSIIIFLFQIKTWSVNNLGSLPRIWWTTSETTWRTSGTGMFIVARRYFLASVPS